MSEFTSIQISKEVKTKLDLVKGENNLTYNQIVEKLLEQSGGTIVDDVIEITREATALSLKYWEYDNADKLNSYDVSYQELKLGQVGRKFYANPNPDNSVNYINSEAEIVAKNGDDVILLVKEVSCVNGVVSSISNVVHINLF